ELCPCPGRRDSPWTTYDADRQDQPAPFPTRTADHQRPLPGALARWHRCQPQHPSFEIEHLNDNGNARTPSRIFGSGPEIRRFRSSAASKRLTRAGFRLTLGCGWLIVLGERESVERDPLLRMTPHRT